jgi:hypothetical protein
MKRVYREHFIALLAFSLLAVLMTLPVISQMQTHIAGTGGDPWQSMWRFEAKSHLLDGTTTSTDVVKKIAEEFFGFGVPHLTNLSVWPWMPLHALFGEPFAYNLIWLLHFILAGYAMALLVKILTNRASILEPAPMLAGIAYMFMPYHIAHSLGHFGAMQLEWIPFIVAAAIVFFRSPGIWRAVLLGLLLTIQSWTEHHYIVWLFLFAVLAAFVYRSEVKFFFSQNKKTTLPALLVLLFIIVIGIVLPFIPTIRLATEGNQALALGINQTIRFSSDLFSFITPPPSHPLWGNAFNSLFGQYFTGNEAENVQYIGITLILALLFFHRHIPVKQKRVWTLTLLFFGIMSLGPVLHIFGTTTNIPLPYALIANLPIFSAIRVIARAGVMVSFSTAVLFGWVIATNFHRPRTSFIVALVILLEFLFIPFPMQSAKLSPVYDALTTVGGSTILEIPAATNYVAASRSLYASSLHKKEVLGNIALERGQDESTYAFIKSIPGVRQLLYLRTTELSQQRNEFFDQDVLETLPDAMKYLDAQAIVVHTDSLSATQNTAIHNFLQKNPGFTEQPFDDALLYTLNHSKSSQTDGVFVVRGDGWENIGYDPKRQSVFGEIPEHASLSAVNVLDHPVSLRLSFTVPNNSPNSIAIRDEFGTVLQIAQVGETVAYMTTVEPGVTQFSFSHIDTGKAIIQNPKLTILP